MGGFPQSGGGASSAFSLVGAANNVPLVNGTPTIIGPFTLPTKQSVLCIASLFVPVIETGGLIFFSWHDALTGNNSFIQMFNASLPVGLNAPALPISLVLSQGSTVSILQGSAMTAGAANLDARIYAAA